MLFKLAYQNMRKSIKDYSIYFFTLLLGVAIFYVFNAMESTQAILMLNDSKMQIMGLLTDMLGYISIFVSVILGGLIVYASQYLMKRRKKEFGIYMLLGMSKKEISKILLTETLLIGFVSLLIGLLLGVIASQFMSLFVASLFEADMDQFTFTFSLESMMKTIVYFAIIYVVVMLLHTFSVSKTKLISLLQAQKQNETVKLKNTYVSILLFIVAIMMLADAYATVLNVEEMQYFRDLGKPVLLGCVGTFLLFYSFAGFVLKLAQSRKSFYYKNLNMFVVRQLHSKINTAVMSMSVISLLLFLTICVLSSGLSINQSLTQELETYAPMDMQFKAVSSSQEVDMSQYAAKQEGLAKRMQEKVDLNAYLSSYIETPIYIDDNLMVNVFFASDYSEAEVIISVDDYNALAKELKQSTYTLENDQFMYIANFSQAIEIRDEVMSKDDTLVIKGKTYTAKYNTCQDGFIEMGQNPMNTGILIVPNETVQELELAGHYLTGNLKMKYKEDVDVNELLQTTFYELKFPTSTGYGLLANSQIDIYVNSVGLGAISTFVGLYLGIVFLISSAAILALKELSESTDNKERYEVLRKIGVEQSMINHALGKQIAIFFFLPLFLGCIHAYFGIAFGAKLLPMFMDDGLVFSTFMTAIILLVVYGGYFVITYLTSKRIIRS